MRGDIVDFAESLTRRVALLEGLPCEVLERVYRERLRLAPGAENLVQAAHANGIYLLLVSGGFTYFADRLKDSLQLDAAFANQLEADKGRLTGRLRGKIVDAAEKAKRVKEAMRATRCSSAEAIVIGDGANDVQMMTYVDHSIAYRARPMVKRLASLSVTFGSFETINDYLS